MWKLVRNENMKIYLKNRTWIMLGLLVLGILLLAVVIHAHPSGTAPAMSAWTFVGVARDLSTILIAFILVVSGDIVSSEFTSGTIKMLLTQSASRTQILASKYAAMLIFGLLATCVLFLVAVLVGGIFFGLQGVVAPQAYPDAYQATRHMPVISYLLMQYGFLLEQIIMMSTIAFMISTIFRSSALAITISLLSFVVGNTLVHALGNYAWVKYILFANTDISQFVIGGPQFKGITLGFSITMLVIYFIIMNLLSWLFFVKRDVSYTS